MGIGFYFWFGYLEEAGGSMRIPIIFVYVYEKLGKLGILGVCCTLGVLALGSGSKRLISGDE